MFTEVWSSTANPHGFGLLAIPVVRSPEEFLEEGEAGFRHSGDSYQLETLEAAQR
jgi:hypothetical protein